MKIIGLTGYAGSGKDFTFNKLEDFYAPGMVRRYAFADEVRREAAEEVLHALSIPIGVEPLDITAYGDEGEHYIYGVNQDLGTWTKPYTEAQRALLQWWGTDFRRAQDPDYWLDKTLRRMHNDGSTFLSVFTDVRFANEAETIRALGGIVVEVWASEEVRAQRLGGRNAPSHPSETIDFEVDSYVSTDIPDRVLLGPEVTAYLGLPKTCTKCRTLYKEHMWHDDGTPNSLYSPYHA